MHFVSYNIQFGKGKDGRIDLPRIADEVGRGAAAPDVIALQEVERFFAGSGMTDQAADIAGLFPDHHWAYGPGVDTDASTRREDGRLVNRRRQFGNMLLARAPILSSRNHLLPKLDLGRELSIQRAALEGVIATPGGAIRVYSLHLAHASAGERRLQVAHLLKLLHEAPGGGGVWSGGSPDQNLALGGPQPPMPRPAVVLGDFNLTPVSREYGLLTGATDGVIDAWIEAGNGPAGGETCREEDGPVRIDYAFLTPDLAGAVRHIRVDREACGSDHQPLHVELDLTELARSNS